MNVCLRCAAQLLQGRLHVCVCLVSTQAVFRACFDLPKTPRAFSVSLWLTESTELLHTTATSDASVCECLSKHSVSLCIIRVLMLMRIHASMGASVSALVCVAGCDVRKFPDEWIEAITAYFLIHGLTQTHSTGEVYCCTMLWHQMIEDNTY